MESGFPRNRGRYKHEIILLLLYNYCIPEVKYSIIFTYLKLSLQRYIIWFKFYLYMFFPLFSNLTYAYHFFAKKKMSHLN